MVLPAVVQRAMQSPQQQRNKKKFVPPTAQLPPALTTDTRQSAAPAADQEKLRASKASRQQAEAEQNALEAQGIPKGGVPVGPTIRGGMVTTDDGRTFLGVGPDDVMKVEAGEQRFRDAAAIAALPAQQNREQRILQEQAQLQERGAAERQNIAVGAEGFASPAENAFDRNTLAGQAVVRALTGLFGVEVSPSSIAGMTDEQLLEQPAVTRAAISALGFAGNFGVGNVRVSALFAPESASLKNLEGDARDILTEQKHTVRFAVNKGSDVASAIQSARLSEAKLRNRFNQAQTALRNSPQDRADGLDLSDSIYTALIVAQNQREMLERYAISLDPTEILTKTNDLA